MTRFALVPLVLMVVTGCSQERAFTHSSTLHSQTRGVVLENDSSAQAGMGGATCEIVVRNGDIQDDVDVADGDDVMVDAFNDVILVRGDDGLYTYESGQWSGNDLVLPGDYVDGAFIDTGVIGISTANGISVDWSGDLIASTAVAGTAVTGSSFDRTTGTAFVASDNTVSGVTNEGAVELAAGDLVVWDAAAEVLYVADLGGTELQGLEADGSVRFAADLGGPVTSLTALGMSGQAIAMVESGNGGELVTVDGFTGEIVETMGTPGTTDALASSESGDTLAIVKPNTVYFLRR